ncbi:MAG: hypothetical protein ISP49_19870 [Reyranella sp.]|nr:hypothetical protein [Reyranella sp.]MBL6653863.1 hypothetical protein [Reyranella sp.]
MNYQQLLERHPEVTQDRHALSFTRQAPASDIGAAYAQFGVVQLKEALPSDLLAAQGEALRRYLARQPSGAGVGREAYGGTWHAPWSLGERGHYPAATVIAAVIRSWIWDVVENLCGSSQIVLLLKWCTVRQAFDTMLGVGAHQDAKVVAKDAPFSLWIPFNRIFPGEISGLGFVMPAPDGLLPTLPHDDVGGEYVLKDPSKLWIPSYAVGDLTIHSRFSPHFTTGYGTKSERLSLEIRAMARRAAPEKYLDPSVCISRRQGIPTIVGIRRSDNAQADDFLASADLRLVA